MLIHFARTEKQHNRVLNYSTDQTFPQENAAFVQFFSHLPAVPKSLTNFSSILPFQRSFLGLFRPTVDSLDNLEDLHAVVAQEL
jgi:hypothetical protein